MRMMAEIHFRSTEVLQNESDVTNRFRITTSIIHFVGISHLSLTVQELFNIFLQVQWWEFFFICFGRRETLTLKFFIVFAFRKGTSLVSNESSSVKIGPAVRPVASGKNKEVGRRSSGNCILF
jgi:hypothetical protein